MKFFRHNDNSKTEYFKGVICRYPFLSSVVLVAIYFIFFLMSFNPGFLVNDDVNIMMIVSGFLTGQPDEHMIYTNIIIGRLLSGLYKSYPAVNWYTIYLYCVYYISMVFLVWVFLINQRQAGKRLILILLLLFLSCIFILLFPTFTTASTAAALSGIFVLLTFCRRDSRISLPAIIAGITLLLLSGLIRIYGLYLVILLALPVLLWRSWSAKSIKLITLTGLAVILSLGAVQYDKTGYSNENEWAGYYGYSRLISLQRNPDFMYSENTKPIFDKVNWSYNDWFMFVMWFYEDKDVYSKDKLMKLSTDFSWGAMNISAQTLRHFSSNFFLSKNFLILNLLIFTVCLIMTPKGPRVILSLTGLTAVLISLFFLASYYLPAQGFVSIINFAGLTGIFLLSENTRPYSYYLWNRFGVKKLIYTAILAVLLIWVWQLHLYSIENRNADRFMHGLIQKIAQNKKQFFVVWPRAIPYELISPFTDWEKFNYFRLHPLDYISHSPVDTLILKNNRIDNLYIALLEKDNVLLIAHKKFLKNLYIFLLEHYKTNVNFEQIFEYSIAGNEMGVYKVIPQD